MTPILQRGNEEWKWVVVAELGSPALMAAEDCAC